MFDRLTSVSEILRRFDVDRVASRHAPPDRSLSFRFAALTATLRGLPPASLRAGCPRGSRLRSPLGNLLRSWTNRNPTGTTNALGCCSATSFSAALRPMTPPVISRGFAAFHVKSLDLTKSSSGACSHCSAPGLPRFAAFDLLRGPSPRAEKKPFSI